VIADIIFWAAAAVCVYVYLGYPLLLGLLRTAIRNPVDKAAYEPFVSLLIPAYNEARVIRQKIQNSLTLDYPADHLEIVVVSDGSTDGTAEIAQEMADDRRVRVIAYPVNRGKILAMNDTVPQLRGEIVVFSDASSMLMPDAVRELAANFHDLKVGAASGVYKLKKTGHTSIGGSEELYWMYETFIKAQEAALDSILGGHGHLHAIRRELYPFPPADTINDDYVISVRIVSRGYRAAYEPKAVGYEDAAEMAGFGRRVRIMTGNVQQLREIPALLWPPRVLPLFFFLSHKAGRLAVPLAMITLLAANLFLLGHPFYLLLMVLQLVFYALAVLGAAFPLKPKILRLPYYFGMINAAAFFGIYHALSGRRRLAWK
jgi:cellulose synthase/poly-beta-1,6-N-acetylglucosamine synthase-like glycosyltransferase